MTRGSDDPRTDEVELEEITLEEPIALEPDVEQRERSVKEPVAFVVSLLLIAWLVFVLNDRDNRPMVFPDRTGQVLIFQSNGSGSSYRNGAMYGAVSILDLDNRVVVRRYLRGNAPGDQGYFLLRQGGGVAYGWGDVYRASLDGSRPRVMRGRNSLLHPGAEPGDLLVFSYRSRSFSGVPTVREYDARGHVVRQTKGMKDGSDVTPARGVPGGMAYNTDRGVALWDWEKQRVTRRYGTGRAWVSAGRRNLLAWCDGDCATLHLTRIGGRDRVIRGPRGTTLGREFPPIARFSPDGRWLAVIAGRRVPWSGMGWMGSHVLLVDVRTGRTRTVYRDPTEIPIDCTLASPTCTPPFVSAPTWSSDGERLFFVSYAQETDDVWVGEYVLRTSETHTALVPSPGIAPLAFDASSAKGMLDVPVGTRCVQTDISFDMPTCAARF
jgi:hypothetical protein